MCFLKVSHPLSSLRLMSSTTVTLPLHEIPRSPPWPSSHVTLKLPSRGRCHRISWSHHVTHVVALLPSIPHRRRPPRRVHASFVFHFWLTFSARFLIKYPHREAVKHCHSCSAISFLCDGNAIFLVASEASFVFFLLSSYLCRYLTLFSCLLFSYTFYVLAWTGNLFFLYKLFIFSLSCWVVCIWVIDFSFFSLIISFVTQHFSEAILAIDIWIYFVTWP